MSNTKSQETKRFQDFEPEDWRKRPRRDARGLRSAVLNIRMTPAELGAIKEQAEMCNMTVSDYVVCRALRQARRVPLDDVIT